MPPGLQELHINVPLSNFGTQLGTGSNAAPFISPVLPVEKESDKYWIGGREELNDDVETLRAPGTPARTINWGMETGDYSADEHALAMYLPHRIRDNADSPIRPQQKTITKLRGKLDLKYEKKVKAYATNLTVVPNGGIAGLGAGADWDAASGTKIELNVFNAKEKIAGVIGREPNRIVIPKNVAIIMAVAPELLDLRKAWDQTLLIDGMLPSRLWGMEVLIPGSLQNTANPGQAAAIARVWTDASVLLFYYEEPSLEYSGFGLTLRKRTAAGTDYMVKEWLDVPGFDSDLFQMSFIQDAKIINPEAGYYITTVYS